MKKFNVRQQNFIKFYKGNATEAALKAGYSKKTAYSIGQRLLKGVEIKQAIQNRVEKSQEKHIKTIEEMQIFLSKNIDNEDLPMNERTKMIELLGKSMAMFTDVQRHEGNINILPPIKINHTELKI